MLIYRSLLRGAFMNIPRYNQGNLPVARPGKQEPWTPYSNGASYTSVASSLDGVIDCVEIQSAGNDTADVRQMLQPVRSGKTATEKGVLIDLWI